LKGVISIVLVGNPEWSGSFSGFGSSEADYYKHFLEVGTYLLKDFNRLKQADCCITVYFAPQFGVLPL